MPVRPAASELANPSVPTSVTATNHSVAYNRLGRSIKISWTGTVAGDQFEIQRATSSGGTFRTAGLWGYSSDGYPASTNNGGSGYWVDSVDLAEGTTYYYRVRRVRGTKVSAWSGEVNATTYPSHTVATAASSVALLDQANPNTSSNNSGVVKMYSNNHASGTSTSNGYKTAVKFPATVEAGSNILLFFGSTGTEGNVIFASGCTYIKADVFVDAKIITADFTPSTLTWNNYGALTTAAYTPTHHVYGAWPTATSAALTTVTLHPTGFAGSPQSHVPLSISPQPVSATAYGVLLSAYLWAQGYNGFTPVSLSSCYASITAGAPYMFNTNMVGQP